MDRGLLTDEALCEEASKYVDLFFIPMGVGISLLLLLLLSTGEKPVAEEGPVGSLRGCFRIWMGAGGTTVTWRGLAILGLLHKRSGSGNLSISCRFKNCEDGFMWFFTAVYGPTMKRFPSERSRVGRLSGSMRRFSEVLDELALRDLPLQGGPYTWSGGLNGQSRSRLDRFLISEDWENHFSGVSQCTLPRPVSDHSPILLDGGGVRRGPIPSVLRICDEGGGI
ncbi:hypothetical protein CK203_036517 [Vitis vinifera]|uniref:Endonuclease/exonuclease/phosphatase domain-containing protein n=1 Tax=Vitis vinifera TaxID=29760 RepID=A0A438HZQ6_VITVI|nr:hypothetical protein CK203_036517 [Vitis vinifera]